MTKNVSKVILATMAQKILLVGDPRICPQVAYVMDWPDFEQVEQLTDVNKYRNYKIVVCAFKKRSKKLIKIESKALKVIYLDDICRELDATVALREAPMAGNGDKPLVPFWRRVYDRLLKGEVIRATWRTFLRLLKRKMTFRSYWLIKRLPVTVLRPSELLIKVLYSPSANVTCERLGNFCYVDHEGKIWGCCSGLALPFGSAVLLDQVNVYDYPLARIIKLSALNHSYCFCNLKKCQYTQPWHGEPLTKYQSSSHPQEVVIATERSCNLRCRSCQKCQKQANPIEVSRAKIVHEKLLQADWLTKATTVHMAGMGEVFYGAAYRELLVRGVPREQIFIRTNGLLLNERNWQLLKGKYKQIEISVSVDAATATTYQKVRGGDFKQLQQNLRLLSELRKNNELQYLEISCVVQRDNYQEMVALVKLGQALHADRVFFGQLENWGTYTRHDYARRRMLVKNRYLVPELYAVLQDPIFNDPIVNITAFQPYLTASAKRYGECNETSGRVTDDKKRQ